MKHSSLFFFSFVDLLSRFTSLWVECVCVCAPPPRGRREGEDDTHTHIHARACTHTHTRTPTKKKGVGEVRLCLQERGREEPLMLIQKDVETRKQKKGGGGRQQAQLESIRSHTCMPRDRGGGRRKCLDNFRCAKGPCGRGLDRADGYSSPGLPATPLLSMPHSSLPRWIRK